MSDPNQAPASKMNYFVVYAVISALILLAAGVSFMDIPNNRVYYNLVIAGVQACLLSYFFMHLKGAEQLTWLVAGAGLFWIFILFLFVLTDYVTRDFGAY